MPAPGLRNPQAFTARLGAVELAAEIRALGRGLLRRGAGQRRDGAVARLHLHAIPRGRHEEGESAAGAVRGICALEAIKKKILALLEEVNQDVRDSAEEKLVSFCVHLFHV